MQTDASISEQEHSSSWRRLITGELTGGTANSSFLELQQNPLVSPRQCPGVLVPCPMTRLQKVIATDL